MKFYFRLIISLAIIELSSITAMAQEGRNLIWNGDFEKHYIRTFIYDGVDRNGYLDVGDNSSPAMADINGDGKKDLVVGSSEGLIFYYLNQGTYNAPQFGSASFFQPHYGERTFGDVKVHLVDWNNDNRMDILLGTRLGWVYLLKGKGDGKFGSGGMDVRRNAQELTGLKDFDIGTYAAPASIDWNRDRNKDLILGEGTYGANSVYVFLNKGSNTSPSFNKDERHYLAYGEGREHLTPAIIDWDRDGDYDLIAGQKKGYLNLYLNNKPIEQSIGKKDKIAILDYGKQLRTTKGPIRLYLATPWTVDWDNDGDTDILSGSSDGRIYLFLNEGTKEKPKFSPRQTLKGKDKQASTNTSNNFTETYDWRKRNGVYLVEIDETKPYSGTKCLKLSAMGGYSGSTAIYASFTLHDNKKYILTFYTSGQNIKGSCSIYYSERTVAGGKRKSIRHTIDCPNVSSSGWRKVEKKFELPTKGKGKAREGYLRFSLNGKGPFYLDKMSLHEVK